MLEFLGRRRNEVIGLFDDEEAVLCCCGSSVERTRVLDGVGEEAACF